MGGRAGGFGDWQVSYVSNYSPSLKIWVISACFKITAYIK